MTDPWKETGGFEAFEVAACYPLGNDQDESRRRRGQLDQRQEFVRATTPRDLHVMGGMIYTVYGCRGGYTFAIGDFADPETARAIAESLAMTRRDVPIYDLIPDGKATTKKTEPETKWVLEHEL